MSDGQEPTAAAEGQEPEPQQNPQPTGQEPGGQKPESFSREYVEKLRREAAGYRTRLQEIEDAGKTEQEKLAERLTAAETAAQEATTRLLRFEVARDKGIDLELAELLTGTSREEMEAKAEILVAKLQPESPPAHVFDGGVRKIAPAGDMNSLIRQRAGRG